MSKLPSARPEIRRVLLTGALGNIGRRVIQGLGADFELVPTDIRCSEEGPEILVADLMDFAQVDRLMDGMDAIVHLAVTNAENRAATDTPGKIDPVDERLLRVNTTSTFHVLEAARRHGIKRVVYASSMTVLLGDRHRESYDSTTPLEPSNLYACTKHFGENLARQSWRNCGLSTICLRIGQPTPVGHLFDDLWQTNKRARSWFVEIGDIVRGISCALRTATPSGVYPLVSASDNPRVVWQETQKAIGYVPRAYFSDSGLSFHENGDFPVHDGTILTHNPGEEKNRWSK